VLQISPPGPAVVAVAAIGTGAGCGSSPGLSVLHQRWRLTKVPVGDCSFDSYEQCQATSVGRRKAYCDVNPFFPYPRHAWLISEADAHR